MKTKECYICGKEMTIDNFHKCTKHKDGLDGRCKACKKEYMKTPKMIEARKRYEKSKHGKEMRKKYNDGPRKNTYYHNSQRKQEMIRRYQKTEGGKATRKKYNNSEKGRSARRKYAKTEKGKKAQLKSHDKRVKLGKIKKYVNNRIKTDIKFKLNLNVACYLRNSLKKSKNGRHWADVLGYNINDLKKHLEKTMPNGYTWQDYLDGKLHIDHIIPISAFNYEKIEDIDFIKCWSLNNLQLLEARKNIIKKDKLERPFQPSLIFDA